MNPVCPLPVAAPPNEPHTARIEETSNKSSGKIPFRSWWGKTKAPCHSFQCRIACSPVSTEIDVVAMPGDGVDLLGEDGVEDAPQEDVEVAQQEEEHRHGLGRLRGI